MTDFTDDVLTDDLALSEQVEGTDETAEVEELQFLDIEQFKDYQVTAKVDGEEVVIPIAEAVAGYQRQADYTRKAQEVSKLKEEVGWGATLKAALENDPAATIQLLAANYGVPLGQAQQAPTDPWATDDGEGWGDPGDKRVAALEARLAQIEQERQAQELRMTINSLQTKYGDDFNAQDVVRHAMQYGINDLEAAYKMLAFDRVAERAAKAAAAAEAATKRTTAATAAKREASVVAGGSASGGRTANSEVGPVSSIRDAYEAAKRQLGA